MTRETIESQPLPEICIIGLGYVGLTLAVAMANAGYRVHGVEKAAFIRECVEAGRAHFSEAGLDEPLGRHVAEGRLTVSERVTPTNASVYIITVGTPLTKDGAVNLASLEDVLDGVAGMLRDGDLVILRSTVKAGTSRGIAKRALDATGRDYDLAFCPERTLEGKALAELTSLPQIVGGLTERATEKAAAVFLRFAPKIIRVGSLEAAEMVKLVNNTQRDLMFAFANEVAEMCDATGVSAIEVIRAACEDYPRSSIALPGPVGGPCLEKDPHILAEGLREVNYVPRISLAGRQLNEELPRASITRIGRTLASLGVTNLTNARIVILGLAFKGNPETNDLRGTMAAHILEAARARWPHARYAAYDPIVPHEEFAQFDVEVAPTLEDAFDDASLVLIQNNHRAFAAMPIEALVARMAAPGIVYDYWNLFAARHLKLPAGRHYAGLGTLSAIGLPAAGRAVAAAHLQEAR